MGFAEMRRWLALVIVAAGLAGAAAPVLAQEIAPEHLALARKYVDLTDRSKIYERTLADVAIETMQVLVQQNPDLQEPLGKAIETTLDAYKDRRADLVDQFARVYAIRFTPDELQQIVSFYETPAGQKLSAVNSAVNTDMQMVMGVFQNNLRQEFFARVRSEMKTAGFDVGG